MRDFEIDDMAKAAAGDRNAQMRVERRKDVAQFFQEARKEALSRATPSWSNKQAIKAIYLEAKRLTVETGIKHEVDHIVPIQHKKVCGLHVVANLQILNRSENARKHSKFNELNISDQLEAAGVKVIIDKRKLNTALKKGKLVVVADVFDNYYRIARVPRDMRLVS